MRDPTDLRGQEHDAQSEELQAREKRRKELEDIKSGKAAPSAMAASCVEVGM
jgi:hypothetical protein